MSSTTPHLLFLFIMTIFLNLNQFKAAGVKTDPSKYLQPNDVIFGNYDNLLKTDSKICARKCDGKPKVCYYRFVIEPYDVLGPACGKCPNNITDCSKPQCIAADGFEKPMVSVNRMLPGPAIYVCKNDRVVVDVDNRLYDKAVTIHWHGIRQMGSPYMDGVPMVTQCPIYGGQTFRYDYRVPTAGTFFWHSHDGLQKEDGIQGPLIVRDIERNDFNQHLYDHDLPSHVVFVSDWLRTLADARVPGTLTENSGQRADAFLVNGKGIQSISPPLRLTPGMTPMAEFKVKKGRRYRFRFIGGTCLDCAVEVSIQSHRMTLITTDGGNPTIPTEVSSISLLAGDRFDVIVHANKDVGTYWIYVRGLGFCAQGIKINQFALLKYAGSKQELPSSPNNSNNGPEKRLNLPNAFCNASSSTDLCLSQIQSPIPPPRHIAHNSKKKTLVIQFGFLNYTTQDLFIKGQYKKFFIPVQNVYFKALVNNISFTFPSSPLLYQLQDIPKDEFCHPKCHVPPGDSDNCNCPNIYSVPLQTTLTLIVTDTEMYDPDGLTHPFHLHGYNFWVLEMGVFEKIDDASLKALIRRLNSGGIKNASPVLKDTIGIPSGGYAVISLFTDNPGYWIFHCHFLYHLEMGMGAVLQTGDPREMAQPPPGFPRCSSYTPPFKI